MRAMTMFNGRLELRDVAEPEPGPGQLLVEPLSAGVCGGDLSALEHTDDFLESSLMSGTATFIFDKDKPVVFGHEFTSRVLEVGAGVEGYAAGDLLLNLPYAIDGHGVSHCVGYATDYPGALGDRSVVQAPGQIKIPDGLDPYVPAVCDPLATGLNGVVRSKIEAPHGALVTGCGPVGLGAVWECARRGIHPLVASDPSPRRRRAALDMGAQIAVDPAVDDPVAAWRDLAEPGQRLYVYEASGKAGLINTLLYTVPAFTRITVVGACMTDDTIKPIVGIYKNVTIEFSIGAGLETEYQFANTFDHLATGRIDASKVITGWAGLEAVPEVFEQLRPGDPHDIEHVKILIRHDLEGPGIRTS